MGRDLLPAHFPTPESISTHTPAWGVTTEGDARQTQGVDFNSHARVGRDRNVAHALPGNADFNSHARVGRDEKCLPMLQCNEDFNSHARVGRDRVADRLIIAGHKFQLTRPRGA